MSDRKLAGYFDKSASLVHDACKQFERHYARPAYNNMRVYFKERPIISTFVTIFTLLSLVPIAFFAGTAVFIFFTFTLVSLFFAILAAFAVILFCFGFLSFVLLGTFFASIFLTGAALSSYSFLRLALHVQREGPSTGVSEWGREAKYSFLTTPRLEDKTGQRSENRVPTEERHKEEEEDTPKAFDGDGDSDKESEITLKKEESEDGEGREDEKFLRHYATNVKYGDHDGETQQGHQ